MFIIMLGVPGAGKGTQSKILTKKLNVPQISTGDLFRDEMERETELGKKITHLMNSGQLVPDETTMEIFKQRVSQPDCQDGAVLDGIPRTIIQAKILDILLKELDKPLDRVLYIKLSEDEIINRLTGRWTCKKCGHIYHERYSPPKTSGICDFDQSPLYQREDQKEGAIKERLKVYRERTEPLIAYYRSQELLTEIDGQQTIEKVSEEIFEKLNL
jgi:adenylate kinase